MVKDLIIDMKSISPAWGSTSWMYGFGSGFCDYAFTPSSAGLFRMLSMGELSVTCFNSEKLFTPAAQQALDTSSLKKFQKSFAAASKEVLTQADLQMYSITLTKGQVMFVPPGWFVIESWKKGPLLFGVRKSLFIDLPSSKVSFAKCIAMCAADGKDVTKMKEILAKFSS